MAEVTSIPTQEIATLLPVTSRQIGAEPVQAINARDLHKFLEVQKDFSDWIKAQIERARLVEHRDFEVFPFLGENSTGRPRTEYALSIESAKHISMMSGTDKGFEVRDYFIECERRAHATPRTQAEIILATAQQLVDQERRVSALECRLSTIEARAVEAEEELATLPAPTVKIPHPSIRSNLNLLVRDYCRVTGTNHNLAWNFVYREYRDRYHLDLKARAKHQQIKPLDLAEDMNVIDELYAVAFEVLDR